jgi:hypothetical protein
MSTAPVARAGTLPPTAATSVSPPADAAQSAAAPSAPAAAPTSADGTTQDDKNLPGIPLDKGLEILNGLIEDGMFKGQPILSPDGDIYLETAKYETINGKISLRYVRAGHVDKENKRFLVDPAIQDYVRANQPHDPSSVTEQDGQYYYKKVSKGEDGKLVSTLEPIPADQLEKLKTDAQKQKDEQAQQQWLQDKYDWINKLNSMATTMKTVGYTGNMVQNMAAGPNPYSGRSNVHWMSAYMTAQMIDAQAGGKLLPGFLKEGPVAKMIDWGMQGYWILNTIPSLNYLGQRFPGLAHAMHIATAPTRAIFQGAASLTKGLTGHPAAVAAGAQAAEQAAQTAAAGVSASAAATAAAESASVAAQQAAGISELANGIGSGGLRLVGAGDLAEQATLVAADGAVHIVPKAAIKEAYGLLTASNATGAAKVAESVNNGLTKGFGGLMKAAMPMLQPLMIGGSVFSVVSGAMYAQSVVKTQGAKALVTTKQGRSAAFSLLNGATFLAMMVMPGEAMVANAALNVANTVIGGVSMLDSYGLFGGGGFLDHQATRAAFLIPPLTPIGLAAMWFKHRDKKQAEKAVAAKQQLEQVGKQVTSLREQAANQLSATGTVANVTRAKDGSLLVPTGVDEAALDKTATDANNVPEGLSEDEKRRMKLLSQRGA